MSAAHTPGDWHVVKPGVSIPGYHVCSRIVSDSYTDRSSFDDPAEDDLALMAEAPRLLAALKSAVASFEQLVALNRIPENMKGLRDARAAIAKVAACGGEAT